MANVRFQSAHKIWRAGDPDIGDEGLYWTTTREDAEAYLYNPPFGGPCLFEAEFEGGKVLDLTDDNLDLELVEVFARSHFRGSCKLRGIAEEDCDLYFKEEIEDMVRHPLEIESSTGRRIPYTLWEDCDEVMDFLKERGYAAVLFEDDFPRGCRTIMLVNSKAKEPKAIYCRGDKNG